MPLRPSYTISQEHVQLSARAPVRVQPIDQVGAVDLHDHEFCEVVVVRRGSAEHVTQRGRRALDRGDLLVLKPGQVHAFRTPRELAVTNIYYLAEAFVRDGRLLAESPQLCTAFFAHHLFPAADPQPVIECPIDATVLPVVESELAWLAGVDRAATSPTLQRASLLKVLALLEPSVRATVGSAPSPLDHPLVQAALAASERALTDGAPADVAAWAAEAGCSADHFTRVIRGQLGETPSALHQRRRLQHAADRLIQGDAALTAIALDLGFADSAHFSRSFKAHYGLSPSVWRQRFRTGG